MKLEFVQSLYFRELDRRFQLDSAPTVRVAALGFLAGVFSFYTARFHPTDLFSAWFFLLCVAGALAFGALTVIWILRSFAGFEWAYLGNPATLLEHYRELEKSAAAGSLAGRQPSEVFEAGLLERLVAATAHNARNNNTRSQLLYQSSIFLAIGVGFTILAGVPVLSEALGHWPLL